MNIDIINSMNYFIIDGARVGRTLNKVFDFQVPLDSLYRGRKEEIISDVAPYLTHCKFSNDYLKWLLKTGWSQSWGIFIESQAQLHELWEHFRNFIIVQNDQGHNLYFRWYDPRVLREFLTTCTKNQIIDFFGPVDKFIMEDKTGENILIFSHINGVLSKESLPAEFDEESLNRIAQDKVASNQNVNSSEVDLIV